MSAKGFYVLVFILLLLFIIPAEVLLKFALFGVALVVIILIFIAYKFNKIFKKFKENQANATAEEQSHNYDEPNSTKKEKSNSIKDDNYDLSKNNVIDTDYEEL